MDVEVCTICYGAGLHIGLLSKIAIERAGCRQLTTGRVNKLVDMSLRE